MKKFIEELKRIAINFKIKPLDLEDDIVSVDILIKVLSDLKKSFYHFAEYEFLNHPEYSNYLKRKPKLLEEFLNSFQLMVVDAKIGSYQSAVAPDISPKQDPIFKDDVLEFKRDTFTKFKDDVAYIDFQDQVAVNSVIAKYPEQARVKFFKPFIDAVSEEKKYSVFLLDENDKTIKKIIPPDPLRKKQIVPIVKQTKERPTDQLVKGYFRITTDGNRIELKKSNIKKIYDLEVLQHDTYPYKPDTIRFENHTFILNEKLHCDVEFYEDQYIIEYKELEIIVWGDSRDKVEEAFCFAFYSLYKNYAEEQNNNLSEGALILKSKILALVKAYYNEA